MNIQELTVNIEKAIKHSLKELGYYDESIEVSLEQPKDKSHGDYASNIASVKRKKQGLKYGLNRILSYFQQRYFIIKHCLNDYVNLHSY